MGWARKNEVIRLYRENKQGTYLLVFVELRTPQGFEVVGEVREIKNPETPMLCTSSASSDYLYKRCKRVSFDEIPENWQKAFREYLQCDGSQNRPEDFRGLWRI